MVQRARKIVLNQPGNEDMSSHNDDGSSVKKSHEQLFLVKLQETIDSDKDISTMTLDQAAKKMAMSKRSLQREMEKTVLTGVSTNGSEKSDMRWIYCGIQIIMSVR